MKIKLIDITPNAEKMIEKIARVCYNSEDKITENSYKTFLPKLLDQGHMSVFEHAKATFYIEDISRACSHQLVRHRMASYTMRSQRYIDEDNFEYVIPPKITESSKGKEIFENLIEYIRQIYSSLKELEINKEDVRMILPNACYTNLFMTMNFRELLHVINLRYSDHAQWEIRDLFKEIYELLNGMYPSIFNENTIPYVNKLGE